MPELPSTRWTSFDDWDYNGMKERLQEAIEIIDKAALIRHAERINRQRIVMSQSFSAGQYWICFEMIAEDDSLVIARVRLPRHREVPSTIMAEDEAYSIKCEIETMKYVRWKLPSVPIPSVFAYEAPGSQHASEVGAVYMLLEGFYGNTLQDIESDICSLEMNAQERIMRQWARIQAELATVVCPAIGSICSSSESGEPVVGKVAAYAVGELSEAGPFNSTLEYFMAVVDSATENFSDDALIGAEVFRDIVLRTELFGKKSENEQFYLNHMDLGPQNILVDSQFNLVAVIDWEFAQFSPWQINRYPMSFPLLGLDIDDILLDPTHLAYKNVLAQNTSQNLYVKMFREAENALRGGGMIIQNPISDALNNRASRIYACFTHLGRLPFADAGLARYMIRLAYGLQGVEADEYIRQSNVVMDASSQTAYDVQSYQSDQGKRIACFQGAASTGLWLIDPLTVISIKQKANKELFAESNVAFCTGL